MNKKFLFFKLSHHLQDELEVKTLSQLELDSLIGEVKAIDNVFQLTKQPELKRIIEKDVSLQNALTDGLANHGRHGYLWVGTELPDIVQAILRLAFVNEIYLFQQLLDPEPEFLQISGKGIPFNAYNIYLWRVYRIWTRQFLMERGGYIRHISQNEIDLDRQFDDLLSSLKSRSFNKKFDNLLHHPFNESVTFNQDYRPYAGRQDTKWIRSIINYLLNKDSQKLVLPFCGNGAWLLEALLANQNVNGLDINPLTIRIAESNRYNLTFNLHEMSQAISEVISNVKMIVNETETPQTDLFLFGTENNFLQFWKNEKDRIKTLPFSLPDENLIKFLAATRFLIESEAVSRAPEINKFLMATLINVMVGLLRKKKDLDIVDEYHKKLRKVYLNIYLLKKINTLFKPVQAKTEVQLGDVRQMEENGMSLILIDLPVHINKSGFEKDRAAIEIMHLHGTSSSLEQKLLGNRQVEDSQKVRWHDQWEQKLGIYPLLNDEAINFLQRLVIADRLDDAIRYFSLWSEYHAIFKKYSELLEEQKSLCIIAEQPSYKLDESFNEIPLGKILKDMIIGDNNLGFHEPESYSKQLSQSTFGHERSLNILIFRKKELDWKKEKSEANQTQV